MKLSEIFKPSFLRVSVAILLSFFLFPLLFHQFQKISVDGIALLMAILISYFASCLILWPIYLNLSSKNSWLEKNKKEFQKNPGKKYLFILKKTWLITTGALIIFLVFLFILMPFMPFSTDKMSFELKMLVTMMILVIYFIITYLLYLIKQYRTYFLVFTLLILPLLCLEFFGGCWKVWEGWGTLCHPVSILISFLIFMVLSILINPFYLLLKNLDEINNKN